jgi:hypothetical protein
LQDLVDHVGNAALRPWMPAGHTPVAVQFFVDRGTYPRYAGAQLILQAARDLGLAARPLAYHDSDGQTQLAVLCTVDSCGAGRLPAPQDHIYDFAEAEYLSLIFQGEQP